MDLKFGYPFKPFQITQRWGNPNAAYAAQFKNPNFKRHNGIDARVGYYTWVYKDGRVQREIATQFPVYAPMGGLRVESVDFEPNGGGNQISLVSTEKLWVGGKDCYVRFYFCHAKKILVKKGDVLEKGELFMIANNTGYSTGLHTHIGGYRLTDDFEKLDVNDATGSFDLEPYFTGKFAADEATYAVMFKSAMRYYRYLISV